MRSLLAVMAILVAIGGTASATATGWLDGASQAQIYGWTCDPGWYSASLTVNIYATGTPGNGTCAYFGNDRACYIGSTVANVAREAAVGSACGGNNLHGFSMVPPSYMADGFQHRIYAVAHDYCGPRCSGAWFQLSGEPKAINPSALCTDCISIRLGRPHVQRGPSGTEMDANFNVIQLGANSYRGFTSRNATVRIDGPAPWSMTGAATAIPSLQPTPNGPAPCGQWLNDTKTVGNVIHGFVHQETACDYAKDQTHMSMAFAISYDQGISWQSDTLPFLTGTDSPTTGTTTGEGSCSVVKGTDAYYYAYCLKHAGGMRTIVARAPVATPQSGNWRKYLLGGFNSPGQGGDSTPLGSTLLGTGAARWTDRDVTVLLMEADTTIGGMMMSLASDKTTFVSLPEPLIPVYDNGWTRPSPNELVAYPSMLSYTDGSNEITSSFLLTNTYIAPNDDDLHRYLVSRDVIMSVSATSVTPQVGIGLARWHNSAAHDRWSTTAPVPGNDSSYAYEGLTGYLMTRPHPTLPTTKLEDCVSTWPGHPDHILTTDGTCAAAGYTRLRTAGWVYQSAQANSIPLYRCYSATEQSHFASNSSTCESLGSMEFLLGYALQN